MKKTILILVVLALLAPAGALAATEFSLGGFIKLTSMWDSTQNASSPTIVINRNNDQLFQHGRFNMTAQESRFNFTIKGPKLWGATTTGFIEMDFDNATSGGNDTRQSNTSSFTPRLRQAMFRLNWPETELLLGQYWGMFSEYAPEVTGDSQFSFHGFVNQRTPQIRVTQKFLGDWTVAGAIVKPYDPDVTADPTFFGQTANGAGTSAGLEGQSSETPQLQAKLAYEKDLYGKAAFYGRPRGFVAQVTGGWQRTRYRANTTAASISTFGQNAFGSASVFQRDQQYLDPWMVQGALFIPVLPTYSASLAGTASLTAQYFIGQGVAFVGGGRDQDTSWFVFSGRRNGVNVYDRKLTNQFGGYLQGQYYFTNQWFLNLTWGFIRDYGFNQGTDLSAVTGTNPAGFKYASTNDQVKLWSEYALTLWYRPIEAVKFGLQYAYERSDFLQKTNNPTTNAAGVAVAPASSGATNVGESHRVQFVAFMYF